MNEKQTFANTGQESFRLNKEKTEEKVILNIDNDEEDLIQIQSTGLPADYGQNFVVRIFKKINRFLLENSTVKIQDKATFFHLLSVMINSGVPMVKALKSLAVQSEKNVRLKMIIEHLAGDIETGSSLSEAISSYEDVFTEQEIGMIQSGEASGQLAKVLERIAIDTEKNYRIRAKVKGAMTYPIVIFCLLIAVIVVMMMYVVPKLTELFNSTGGELPILTRAVIAVSDFFVNNKLTLLFGFLAASIFFVFFRKTAGGRFLIDMFKIKVPLFGKIFRESYLSHFARNISNLIDSQVSIVRTMEITANSMGNEVYRRKILLAQEDIKQGIPLAESLIESDLFPPMMINMIEVGESTAQLDEIMQKVAVFYENEVDNAVSGLSKLIEPLVLIIIGVTVGLIVAAIMLPIMNLGDMVGGL